MLPQIASRIVQLDQYVAQASGKDVPEQIQSNLSRFGAVLLCGLIERSVEHVILERLARRAHPRVLRFIRSHFQRGSNYDCEAIEQLLRRFDNEWVSDFTILFRITKKYERVLRQSMQCVTRLHMGEPIQWA
jgi:hypothetical protein